MLRWSYDIFMKTKYSKKGVKFSTKLGRLYNVSTTLGSSSGDYILWYYLGKGWRVNELNVRQLPFFVRGTMCIRRRKIILSGKLNTGKSLSWMYTVCMKNEVGSGGG